MSSDYLYCSNHGEVAQTAAPLARDEKGLCLPGCSNERAKRRPGTMYYLILFVGLLLRRTFRQVLDPLSIRALKLSVKLGYGFIAVMIIYVLVRYMLRAQ